MKNHPTLPWLIALCLLLVLPACNSNAAPPPCLVYGLTLVPSGIDPHINASSELGIPLTSVYDTLVYQDPDTGAFVPGLAEDWTISDDGRVYTFTLRTDVKFHDGTAFDAQAALFTINRITNPDTHSQKAVFLLGPFERASAPNKRTLIITLKEPFAPLLDGLSQVYTGMVSPAAVQRYGDQYQAHQVGTGPYMFTETGYQGVSGGLDLVRNPDYQWGPSVFKQTGPANIERVCFRFYEEPALRAQKLTSGEAHIVGEIPPSALESLTAAGISLQPSAVPGTSVQLFLNTQKAPTNDVRVRQALLFAANRQATLDTLFLKRAPLAEGPLSANTVAYSTGVVGRYPYDPAHATALLTEAGWQDTNHDGLLDKDGQPLTLDLVIQGWGSLPQISQLLAADWKAVGITTNIVQVQYSEALQIGAKGDYHLFAATSYGSDPDVLRPYFTSQAPFNFSKANLTRLDKDINEAAHSLDATLRLANYSDAQTLIMNEALVLPLYDRVNLNGVSPLVQGLRYDRRGWFPWLIEASFKETK